MRDLSRVFFEFSRTSGTRQNNKMAAIFKYMCKGYWDWITSPHPTEGSRWGREGGRGNFMKSQLALRRSAMASEMWGLCEYLKTLSTESSLLTVQKLLWQLHVRLTTCQELLDMYRPFIMKYEITCSGWESFELDWTKTIYYGSCKTGGNIFTQKKHETT